ncbi:hypothetical protein RB608_24870 [Nocardioides sp. LHD-245]|uniref:hypothetical protein n=1 Tax=Nocardioides sp. LHD-245 TaxID=3051387 RepID=UPI0027DF3F58|nr:hypothetical protein [Nocardioides sp. LHD-245]
MTTQQIPHPIAPSLTEEQAYALDVARALAAAGVPVFVAPPDPGRKIGYRLPSAWQQTRADPAVVDAWAPGYALCAVMGLGLDLLDVDLYKGGDLAPLDGQIPTAYAVATTPSGGVHSFIRPLGVHSLDDTLPGVDVKSGDAEGEGRGFAFIAPTVRTSKVTGQPEPYRWIQPPDLARLAAVQRGERIDESGTALRALIGQVRSSVGQPAADGTPYIGPPFAALPAEQQQQLSRYVAAAVDGIRAELVASADWAPSQTDAQGRGWEKLQADAAWRLGKFARAEWSPLTLDVAREAFCEAAPVDESWGFDDVEQKWRAQAWRGDPAPIPDLRPASERDAEGWARLGFDIDQIAASRATGEAGTPGEADAPAEGGSRTPVNVSNPALATEWLRLEVGREGTPLAGLFARGGYLSHAPAIGQDGYQPLTTRTHDEDGPVQVRRVDAPTLAAQVQGRYAPFRYDVRTKADKPAMFPGEAATSIVKAIDLAPNLRELVGVTHTPMVRADGTVLDQPGYDDATGLLFLPASGLVVPPVPSAPTLDQVSAAAALVLQMIGEFPFLTDHDRANYLAGLLSPLLRAVVPPPYKMIAIGAPERGSGKSLLAELLRIVHGGVLRSETPASEEEFSKQITAILDTTAAPIVEFDNVSGVLRSSVLAGLLTASLWSDRRLGKSEQIVRRNDRTWVITGNNLELGGDLVRRTLWVTIDPATPNPERRVGFAIPDLRAWTRERRGQLLHALLVMIRAWVIAGRPVPDRASTDDYGTWLQVVNGILQHAGIAGTAGHLGAERQKEGSDDEEWGTFLAAAERVFGSSEWAARDLLGRVATYEMPGQPLDASRISLDELPGPLAEKVPAANPAAAARVLGKWLRNREGRWADRRAVRSRLDAHTKAKVWRVEQASRAEVAGSAGSYGSPTTPTSDFALYLGGKGGLDLPPFPALPATPLGGPQEATA